MGIRAGDSQSTAQEHGIRRIVLIPILVLVSLLLLYVGSYVALSANGCYEPEGIGLNGVKWYAWAPRGFVDHYVWRQSLRIAYFPLSYLDVRFWHTYDRARTGEYPIDEVRPEDIGKVYKALGF
jgi:hypothetical protein